MIAGVPQGAGFVVDVAEPAIDLEVGFPEARRLPGHLVGLVAFGAGDGLPEGLVEVVRQLGQQRQGQGDDGVVGLFDVLLAALAVAPDHLGTVVTGIHPQHLGAQAHAVLDLAIERLGNLVHAADRLEHGRGELGDFVEHQRQ
ncbi:hypothetical protein D3C75_817960 [compost metagenome]